MNEQIIINNNERMNERMNAEHIYILIVHECFYCPVA